MAEPADLAALEREIEILRQRVSTLERLLGVASIEQPDRMAGPVAAPAGAAEALFGDTSRLIPLAGRALLGLAGAYLLRALSEFKVLPLRMGVAIAIVYAAAWLILAGRGAAREQLTAAAHASTSVLILMPLIWEATVRFQAISCWTAAAVLALFAAMGLAVSWRKRLEAAGSIPVAAGVLTAAALLLATDNLAPFTLGILAAAGVVELAACLGRPLRLRWLAAGFADLAVLLVVYSLTRAGGLPEGYAAIGPATALATLAVLPAIYVSSATVRTLWSRAAITNFETCQWLAAVGLALGGALRLAPGTTAAVSMISLACGAACYVVSFAVLGRAGQHERNFYTYASFGLLLVFGGCRLLVTGMALALVLAVLALGCLWIGRESGRMTLKWHGTLYLLAAAALSGLAGWAAAVLFPAEAVWTAPAPDAAVAAAAAVLGYALAFQSPRTGSWPWPRRTVVLLLAANCSWVATGFAAAAFAALCHRPGASAQLALFYPTFRTGVLTAWILLMAWSGTRWGRFEAVWLVYPFLAFTAYKLMVQDLPSGQTLPLFASLFVFGGALIWLPRILQKSKRARAESAAG